MTISRVVPNISTALIEESRAFYEGLFGFHAAMDMGWIVTLVSTDTPTAQISLVRAKDRPLQSGGLSLTIEVSDVDSVHAVAVSRGHDIIYPLTDESWGVRRFHVKDPNGVLINVMTHIK